jgi:hypothetical protein
MLTEESFHNTPPSLGLSWGDTHYEDGGFWAHALSDEAFAFTITGDEPPGPGGDMHVDDIAMSKTKRGAMSTAIASVRVVDATGLPVDGVTVSGSWSGVVSGSSSGTTDSSGVAVLKSPKTRSSGTATVMVSALEKPEWTYDASANVEISDSIDLP